MTEPRDPVQHAIDESLANTHYGDILRGEGQTIVYLDGSDLVQLTPTGERTVLRTTTP